MHRVDRVPDKLATQALVHVEHRAVDHVIVADIGRMLDVVALDEGGSHPEAPRPAPGRDVVAAKQELVCGGNEASENATPYPAVDLVAFDLDAVTDLVSTEPLEIMRSLIEPEKNPSVLEIVLSNRMPCWPNCPI